MSEKAFSPSPALRQSDTSFADVPILIHVGPHKTGTTWLQRNLLAAAQGIVYEPSFERSHRAFLHPRYGEFNADVVRTMYQPLLEQARAEQKPLVISDEALCGRPFGQIFLKEIAAERLQLAFPQARILITTREQDAVILSMYSEYLRYGNLSSLEAFLSQDTGNPLLPPFLDLQYYEWDRTLDLYESLFPPDQVLAVPMEWGLSDPMNYPNAIERFLGAPLRIAANQEVKKVERPSLSGWALAVLRRANVMQPNDTRYLHRAGRFSPNSLAFQVDRLTPKSARKRGKQVMHETARRMIDNRFTESNARFQSKTVYDLAALSYRMPGQVPDHSSAPEE